MKLHSFILAIESYLVRKGMVAIIGSIHGARVVREISAASELIRYMKTNQSGFFIVSESMFDAASDVFLSGTGLSDMTILLKSGPSREGDDGVHSSIYLSETREEIIRKIAGLMELSKGGTGPVRSSDLTDREKTIVKLVSLGHTNRQIADKLFLSTHTVMTHRKNITSKLGIKSASGLTVYAIVNNIITIEEATSKPSE